MMTREEAVARYGPIVDYSWPAEVRWCDFFRVPDVVVPFFKNAMTGKPVDAIYCNKDMIPALRLAFKKLILCGAYTEIKTFGGCYCVRKIRGGASWSSHAWAGALDLNPDENPLGGKSAFTGSFVDCFKSSGFEWGGDFRRPDPMHYSWLGW